MYILQICDELKTTSQLRELGFALLDAREHGVLDVLGLQHGGVPDFDVVIACAVVSKASV